MANKNFGELSAASASRSMSLLAALALVACSGLPQVTPYRMEIQQGNMVTQDMVSKLTPGLTKDQVRFILGTPLIVDPFRVDRWDYVFSRQPENSSEIEKRRIIVYFENEKLKRVEGDVVAGDGGGGTPPAASK